MKKYLSLILIFSFVSSNASYAIVDDFAKQTLNKNLKIQEYKKQIIVDDLITEDFIKINKDKVYTQKVYLIDDFVNNNLSSYKNEKLISYVPIDFANFKKGKIKIKSLDYVTTKNKTLKEGTIINFVVAEDFSYNNKRFKKGSLLKAKIENISQNQAFGIPANLEIGNFDISGTKLENTLKINGANRAAWVLPLGYIGLFFFGVGVLIFPIRGGHAKLYKNKTYDLVISDFS